MATVQLVLQQPKGMQLLPAGSHGCRQPLAAAGRERTRGADVGSRTVAHLQPNGWADRLGGSAQPESAVAGWM